MKKLFLLITVIALLFLNISETIDKQGHVYFNRAIKNAATTYLTARGINGAISMIQSGTVMASPAGVGVSISPGEILDPLNDLIEQFSSIMLFATASLGVQKLLLVFSGWLPTKITVFLFLAILMFVIFFNKNRVFKTLNSPIFYKLLIIILSIRFIIPFIVLSNGAFESIFLGYRISEKITDIQLVEKITKQTEQHEDYRQEGWLDTFSNKAKEFEKIKENAILLKEKLSNSVDNIIDLISLFIIQTILLPLVFLFLVLKMAKNLFCYDYSNFIQIL
ncbi:MAG: hypothetical protein JXB25_00200 [Deltaproteobacteria bacterium]|nr:hypothetical protein [Deltaproteobacteria bacterium]